eukprot:scaffold1120_cov19-Tisochrysis_lutea.AAC.1
MSFAVTQWLLHLGSGRVDLLRWDVCCIGRLGWLVPHPGCPLHLGLKKRKRETGCSEETLPASIKDKEAVERECSIGEPGRRGTLVLAQGASVGKTRCPNVLHALLLTRETAGATDGALLALAAWH